jgi:serine/threonine-protein kinase RsbW
VTDLQQAPLTLAGPVELRVPSLPAMSRVLRLASSGVGSLCGFTVEEIEDIKIAVSEVFIALVEHGEGEPVDVRFTVANDEFAIDGMTAVQEFNVDHPDLQLCRMVLASVSSEHRIVLADHSAHIVAVLRRPFNSP